MMEQAVSISKTADLKYVNEKYSRLYFGNEFCEKLIPSVTDLRNTLGFVMNKRLDFSFVTPYVTNIGLNKLKILFELLEDKKADCEIIVNDWGVLNLVNRKYSSLTPVLGRLLTKQKRGPSLIRLLKREPNPRPRVFKDSVNPKIKYVVFQKKLPLELDPYYKGANTSSVPIIHDFLLSQRIQRIELDNTAQGLFLELPKDKICASIYLPYIYITTAFFCPTAGCDKKRLSFLKRKPCDKECQRYIFTLRHKAMPKVIFLKGNTQFYKNPLLSIKKLQKSGVDRIVYEPQIPI